MKDKSFFIRSKQSNRLQWLFWELRGCVQDGDLPSTGQSMPARDAQNLPPLFPACYPQMFQSYKVMKSSHGPYEGFVGIGCYFLFLLTWKELDTTEQLNWAKLNLITLQSQRVYDLTSEDQCWCLISATNTAWPWTNHLTPLSSSFQHTKRECWLLSS